MAHSRTRMSRFRFARSLTFRLSVAFLAVSLGAIVLVAVMSWLAATTEFTRFVGQQAQDDFIFFVTDYYAANASLAGVDKAIRVRVEKPIEQPVDLPRFFPFPLASPDGVVVNPNDGYPLGARVPAEQLAKGTRILQEGRVIAVLLPRPAPFPRNRAQEEFVRRTLNTLLISAGGAALLAILLGVVLARTITRPVQELTDAAQRMAKGELGQTVRVQSRDEVGELAHAFNQMSADLARSDGVRRQMTADIAHELRNPLTVIGGYLDAMRVGDLQPTRQRLDAVYDEIQHLEHIVEDLRTLSLADAGALVLQRQEISPRDVLQRVANRFAPQAGNKQIALDVQADAALPMLKLDEARLTQVLDNLVSNALQHTPEGGEIQLAARAQDDAIVFSVRDSGKGISREDMPHVFERFYRGDKARSTLEGSSGLGLAIAKALVDAHGGKIWVTSQDGQGAAFFVWLPMALNAES